MPPPQPVTNDKAMLPERRPVRGASVLHALAPVLHIWLWRQLHCCGPRRMLESGGENSQSRDRPPSLCLARTPLQPSRCRLSCLALGPSPRVCLSLLFLPHLSFGLFCYLLSSREMYLEEPSSDAVAEPPSLLVLQSERRL